MAEHTERRRAIRPARVLDRASTLPYSLSWNIVQPQSDRWLWIPGRSRPNPGTRGPLQRAHRPSPRVAETFQRSLLTPIAPVAGLEVGVAYVPAFEPEKVGGDFYDLFSLEGGVTAVIAGDVVGKGVEAAVLTQTVRAILRTLASIEQSPSFILTKANELLREVDPPDDSSRSLWRWSIR